jgi:hypothetical protein
MNWTGSALRRGLQVAVLAVIAFGCNNKPGSTADTTMMNSIT